MFDNRYKAYNPELTDTPVPRDEIALESEHTIRLGPGRITGSLNGWPIDERVSAMTFTRSDGGAATPAQDQPKTIKLGVGNEPGDVIYGDDGSITFAGGLIDGHLIGGFKLTPAAAVIPTKDQPKTITISVGTEPDAFERTQAAIDQLNETLARIKDLGTEGECLASAAFANFMMRHLHTYRRTSRTPQRSKQLKAIARQRKAAKAARKSRKASR